jgi:CTP synthase
MGIKPNIIVLRCDRPLEAEVFRKISLFCNVQEDCVIENRTLPSLYEAPLMLEEAGFSGVVCRHLGIDAPAPDLRDWEAMTRRIASCRGSLRVGLVGKYTGLHDAYLSVLEALHHAGSIHGVHIDLKWIDSEALSSENLQEELGDVAGILIPGGFGDRGVEGMILAAGYARENRIPYLGLCLGMQVAVIEFARNVVGLSDANSGEFDELCSHKVIDFIPGQSDDIDKGGTLRLGAYPCILREGTKIAACYGTNEISERHRHRYEFNNEYRKAFEKEGLILSGKSPDDRLIETVEVTDHPFYVGVQFHPEFKSRPDRPHPLFKGFVAAALDQKGVLDRVGRRGLTESEEA